MFDQNLDLMPSPLYGSEYDFDEDDLVVRRAPNTVLRADEVTLARLKYQ